MKSKFSFTWHLRPSRLIPLQPSPSLPDSGRRGGLLSPDPRYALALSWVAPSAGGDFSFLTSLLNWVIFPWLSPDVPPSPRRASCFPGPVLCSVHGVRVCPLHSYRSARGQGPCGFLLLSSAPSPLSGTECVPGKHVRMEWG